MFLGGYMDETTRKMFVEELRKNYEELSSFQEKKARFDELKDDPLVKEFFDLRDYLKHESFKYRFSNVHFNGLDDYISNNLHYKMEVSKCDHDFVMYVGSYSTRKDISGVLKHELLNGDETHPDFAHNGYYCLCCGNSIYPGDYEKFESDHKVLKNYNLYFNRVELHRSFCELLSTMNYDDAVNYLTDYYNGFNDGMRLSRKVKED